MKPVQSYSPVHPGAGSQPCALAADRHPPRSDEADRAVDIGVDHVLHRPDKFLQGRAKARPVGGPVDVPDRLGGTVFRHREGRGQGQDKARIGCAGRQSVRQYRAVPSFADRQFDGSAALHDDHLMPGSRRARCLAASDSGRDRRVDLLDKQILDIGGRRRKSPGDPLVVADHDERRARPRCRRRFRARGVFSRARYQKPGEAKPRCGSLASSGLPLALCAPSTTQLLEA